MGTQGSPVSIPSAEFRVDVCPETMEINRASQDGRKPTSFEDNQRITDQLETKKVPMEGSSEGMAIDQASQDGRTPTLFQVYLRITNQSESKEIHMDVSSKGIVIDKASQDHRRPPKVMPTQVNNKNNRRLLIAAQSGDWKTVEKMLKEKPEAMKDEIMKVEGEPVTVLDVAIMASKDELVKNLIKHFIEHIEFDLVNFLQNAALRGRIKMIKALVDKVDVTPESVREALWYVTTNAPKQKEVIWYLAKHLKFDPTDGTMSNLIKAGHSDVALYLAQGLKEPLSSAETDSILESLAKMESNFRSGTRLNFWEKLVHKIVGILLLLIDTSCDKHRATTPKWFKISLRSLATKPGAALLINRIGLRHKCSLEFANLALDKMNTDSPKTLELLSHIVLEAASRGISEIVKSCFEHFPELTWDEGFTTELMKKVVNGRHVELFRLLNTPGTIPFSTVKTTRKDVWMKAVVEWSPKCLPTDVFGAPFLMQRELQWFKVLDDTSDPSSKTTILKKVLQDTIDPALRSLRSPQDKDQKPYWDYLVENRKQLLQEAGQWMKDTSSSCSLVSTLIITVTFAAIFTVPGGNHQENGIPIFRKARSFILFAVADALALFSSVTTTLMFLAILTSRYNAEDFLTSLPRKMIQGLSFLFLSLAMVLVAFESALTIVLSEGFTWGTKLDLIYIPITFFATILVMLFAILQLPLYFEMLESTHWPRLYRPLKLWE